MSSRAGATTTLPHLISAAISVAYEKHQTASETKLVKATTRLSCAARTVYQLGSAQRKQTSPSSEQVYSGSSVDFVLLHSAVRSSEKHLNSLQNE